MIRIIGTFALSQNAELSPGKAREDVGPWLIARRQARSRLAKNFPYFFGDCYSQFLVFFDVQMHPINWARDDHL